MASHVIMKKSLARALLDAGVEHFDAGGPVGSGSTTAGGVGGAVSDFFGGQSQYRANAPTITTQNVLPSIAGQEGIASDVYGQQQGLAQRLLAESQGQGPNPAQARLNNETGNNIAETQALMASVRGGNSNPGLTALNAGRQGAATRQQAVGQAAQLQAEQELGAQNELAGLYGNEAQNALTAQSILQGAQAAQNSALTTGQLGAEETNAQIAGANANNAASTSGGILSAAGSLLSMMNKGGKVQRFDTGGMATYAVPVDPREVLNFGTTTGSDVLGKSIGSLGKDLKKSSSSITSGASPVGGTGGTMGEAGGLAGDSPDMGSAMGGMTDVLSDVGMAAMFAARGGMVPTDFRSGGEVPGRAKVKGDNPKNDTVPAMLSPGEEVLPRSVTMAPDAPERAKRFVQALMDKDGDDKGYGKVLKARQTLKQRVEQLEKLCYGGRAA